MTCSDLFTGNCLITLVATIWYCLSVGYRQWFSILVATSLTMWFLPLGVTIFLSKSAMISRPNCFGTSNPSSHPKALAGTLLVMLVATLTYVYIHINIYIRTGIMINVHQTEWYVYLFIPQQQLMVFPEMTCMLPLSLNLE